MKKAYLFVILTALLFGTMEVSCKIGGGNLDPFQLTCLRFVIGGAVLLPFGIKELKAKNISLSTRDIGMLTLVGFMGVTVSMSMFQFSVMMCNASTVSVLFCTNPFFTMIFAHFLSDEKLNRYKFGILLIAMAGIVFMFRPWDIQEGNSMQGMAIMIGAALVFGLYTVSAKKIQLKIGLMAQTSISFLIGAGLLMIFLIIVGRPVVDGVMDNIPILLYTGLVVTGMGYFCFFKAIELSDASTASFAFFLKTAIAPVFAVIVLHETILWNTAIGIGVVLCASLMNIVYQKKKANQRLAEVRRQEANRDYETLREKDE